FAFGWAKPTPVNPRNLEGGRYGEAIVAAAGPISNLVLAIAAALPLRFILSSPSLMDQIPTIVLQVLFFFILINLVLMVFNLFPIPPLDGSKVLFAFLPPQVAWRWRPILEQYGFILLLLVFFVPPGDSIGGKILVPIIDALLDFLVGR
ncbi:MAG TPA: site-2 protease family protein, partial [Candidatus Limnocylindrales bacterium]